MWSLKGHCSHLDRGIWIVEQHAACLSDFCWRGHASALLQLGVQCWRRLAWIYFARRQRERERNKKEGIRRIPVPSRSLYISPSLPLCSFKEDAPSQHLLCFVFSPSHRSWVDVAFRCLDAVCVVLFFFLEHDFGVQPGFPPSHRKSVNDFERHNVSKSAKDMCRVLASPLQHRKHRLAFLFFFKQARRTKQLRASWVS